MSRIAGSATWTPTGGDGMIVLFTQVSGEPEPAESALRPKVQDLATATRLPYKSGSRLTPFASARARI
jgi:hypothetical protein